MEGVEAARKHHKPEEVVAKLRQVEVLLAQGKTAAEAVRTIGVTEQTYYRWRSEYGGLNRDQVKRLEQLEQAPSSAGPGPAPLRRQAWTWSGRAAGASRR